MTKNKIIKLLNLRKEELKAMGVKSLSLFGSVVRDESSAESDVDLLIEFSRPVGYFHFFDVQEYLQKILEVPKVDLVMRTAVIDELKDEIYAEALNVI